MTASYSEWKGLFTVTPISDHVLVKCHKGFEDTNTQIHKYTQSYTMPMEKKVFYRKL